MDRRTAQTIATAVALKELAKKLGVTDEDMVYLSLMCITSAECHPSGRACVLTVIRAMMKAPTNVVEDFHTVMSAVKEGSNHVMADPVVMEKITAQLAV